MENPMHQFAQAIYIGVLNFSCPRFSYILIKKLRRKLTQCKLSLDSVVAGFPTSLEGFPRLAVSC